MTMTNFEKPAGFSIILLLLAVLLLTVSCQATDLNTMTSDELQAYILDLQQQANKPQPTQPTVITIEADTQLKEKLGLLQKELADVKTSMLQMQERFNRLNTDLGNTIASGNNEVITDIVAQTNQQHKELYDEITDYVDQKTNPVRQNAPAIGAFLILAGAFLLWASRQYKLTGGKKND